MPIFNSLGTNYTPGMVWRSLALANQEDPARLESQLKDRYQATDVVLTNRGREAIKLILASLSLPEGSYVGVTGYTCYVVYDAIVSAGLKPYFLDIEQDNLNFSAKTLETAIKAQPAIKAVLIQNSLGISADIVAIERVCQEHKIRMIEDLAHSAGLRYADGREAGTVGVAAALSFSQNKVIDASAGGAAVFYQDIEPIERPTHKVSLWQRFTNYLYPLTTYLVRATHRWMVGKVLLRAVKTLRILPDPAADAASDVRMLPPHQAKLTAAYLNTIEAVLKHRQQIAAIYRELLPPEIQFPHDPQAVYTRFPLKIEERGSLKQFLKEQHINIGPSWYETVIDPKRHFHKAVLYAPGSCPNGEWVAERMVNLPTHVNINEETARFIAGKVNQWLALQSKQ